MKKILAALLLAALALTLCACGLIAQPEYTPIPSPTPAPADVDLFRVDRVEGEAETAADTVTETQAVMMLAGLLTKKKNQLPEQERRQLEHLLRTDAWMNGASVPPLPETEETEE